MAPPTGRIVGAVTDRAGVAYATLGSLTLAIVTAYWPREGVAWIVGLVALLIASTYLVAAANLDWPLPGRDGQAAAVALRAHALSRDIAAAAASHRRLEGGRLPRGETWQTDVEDMLRRSSDLMAEYQVRFAVPAAATYERLLALGVQAPADVTPFLVTHPTNLLGMEAVARALGTMASQIDSDGLHVKY